MRSAGPQERLRLQLLCYLNFGTHLKDSLTGKLRKLSLVSKCKVGLKEKLDNSDLIILFN